MEKDRREIHVSETKSEKDMKPSDLNSRKDGAHCLTMPRHVSVGATWSIRIGGRGVFGKNTLFALLALCIAFILLLPVLLLWLRTLDEQVDRLRLEVNALRQLLEEFHQSANYDLTYANFELEERSNVSDGLQMLIDSQQTNGSSIRIRRSAAAKKPSGGGGGGGRYKDGKWLHPCPKNVVAKHYHGTHSQYTSKEGYLYAWAEDNWCTEGKSPKIQYDTTSGGLVVTESGIYIFYVQLTFIKFNQVAEYRIFVNSTTSFHQREVGRCRLRSPADEKDTTLPFSCSTTLLVCLNKQDKVFLKPIKGVLLEMNHTSSFMGLIRLNKMKHCPTYSSIPKKI